VRRLAAEHLTDDIAARLGPETRIRLAVARDGRLDDLLAVIRQDARHGTPETVARGGRRYAAYPGFGRLPDAVFDVTGAPDWPAKLDAVAARWERGALILEADGDGAASVSAEEIPARIAVAAGRTTIRFDVAAIVAATDPSGQRRIVSAQPGAFDPGRALGRQNATGAAGAAAVRAPRLPRVRPRLVRQGRRLVAVGPVLDTSGRLMISVVPLSARRVAGRLLRRR
jgi:hypothetical protein